MIINKYIYNIFTKFNLIGLKDNVVEEIQM